MLKFNWINKMKSRDVIFFLFCKTLKRRFDND